MLTCPRCGSTYPDDARFCPDDGVQLAAAADPHIGKVLLGQFEVREICGKGSMGTVYRAWQASVERDVAVKILRKDLITDPKVVKRFHREARAAARLSHPNIITVFLVGDTDEGQPFLVMEYVTGTSLDRICTEEAPLPPVRAVHIAKQIATALYEAHTHNIVHRDLKPENIILTEKTRNPDFVKVLDFGIAKILYAGDEQLTQTGAIFGTPHYLAPEQASGGEIDHRCDLYALGVILYRMLTGRLPFESPSGMEVLIQHLRETPPRPRSLLETIPQPLEDVVLHCMAKSANDRYQSADELSQALSKVMADLRGPGYQQAMAAAEAQARAYPPTQVGVPAHHLDHPPSPEERVDSDPRFRVPTDAELRSARPAAEPSQTPTESDLGDTLAAEVQAAAQPASQPTPQPARGATDGSTTIGLASDLGLIRRRRMMIHALLTLGSIVGGAAVGAAVYYARRGNAAEPALPPERGAEPGLDLGALQPITDAAPEPDQPPPKATKAAKAAKPKRRPRPAPKAAPTPKPPTAPKAAPKPPKPRPPKPRPELPKVLSPLGPTPHSDHGDSEEPPPRPPEPKAPEPRRPADKTDNFYELVD